MLMSFSPFFKKKRRLNQHTPFYELFVKRNKVLPETITNVWKHSGYILLHKHTLYFFQSFRFDKIKITPSTISQIIIMV